MGIELPAELTGLASASGVRWPRADEDGMRAQAAAWRKAAGQLTTLSSAADGSAAKALSAISGDTADAAGKQWKALADPDSGTLSSAVRGAHATADRLDAAAERIGAAKVAMVRNLVDLAKNHDALRALGNPAAADTALRGTTANVAALHETLTKAVGGQDVPNPAQEPAPNANHGWTAPPKSDPGDTPDGQPENPVARHERTGFSGAHADFPGDAADTGPLPIQHQAGSVTAASAATATPLSPVPADYDVPTPRSGIPQQPSVPPPAPLPPAIQSPGPPPVPVQRPSEGSRQARTNPVAAQGNSKPPDRDVEVIALFRIHMFPIGHMPKPRHRPLRQLPAPDSAYDHAAGLRFPPQDHPRSALVSDQQALAAHSAHEPAPTSVHELAEDYHPFGELHEHDWDRRFLVRRAERAAAEYAWPPGEMHPEGGRDHGEPLVLEPGTELDRFGTEEGRVFGTPDTPFAQRSLPPDHLNAEYRRYRVLRPLPAWWALSAAWFGQPGGGPRYRTTYAAADLRALGYLEPLGDNDER